MSVQSRNPEEPAFKELFVCEQHGKSSYNACCLDHDVLCCSSCLMEAHEGCSNIMRLTNYATSVNQNFRSEMMTERMKQLQKHLLKIANLHRESIESLKSGVQKMAHETRSLKQAVIAKLDDLEKLVKVEGERIYAEEFKNKIGLVKECNFLTTTIRNSCEFLEKMAKATDGQPRVSREEMERQISSYEKKVADLSILTCSNVQLLVTDALLNLLAIGRTDFVQIKVQEIKKVISVSNPITQVTSMKIQPGHKAKDVRESYNCGQATRDSCDGAEIPDIGEINICSGEDARPSELSTERLKTPLLFEMLVNTGGKHVPNETIYPKIINTGPVLEEEASKQYTKEHLTKSEDVIAHTDKAVRLIPEVRNTGFDLKKRMSERSGEKQDLPSEDSMIIKIEEAISVEDTKDPITAAKALEKKESVSELLPEMHHVPERIVKFDEFHVISTNRSKNPPVQDVLIRTGETTITRERRTSERVSGESGMAENTLDRLETTEKHITVSGHHMAVENISCSREGTNTEGLTKASKTPIRKDASFIRKRANSGRLRTRSEIDSSTMERLNDRPKMPPRFDTIVKMAEFRVSGPKEGTVPLYTGVTYLHNGWIVYLDSNNHRCVLCDSSYKFISEYKFSSKPLDVCIVDDNEVAVTLPYQKKIRILKMGETIRPKGKICTKFQCVGIVAVGSKELLVSGHHNDRAYCWGIITKEGVQISSFLIPRDKNTHIDTFIALNSLKTRVYMTCLDNDAVYSFGLNGRKCFEYRSEYLKEPAGIGLDAHDHVYVVGCESGNIHQLNPQGVVLNIITAGLPRCPSAICFNQSGNAFLITDHSTKNAEYSYTYQLLKHDQQT
ncbi:hypothetical protein CHS0354_008057 [Potamilus streckersoni]|uniref:B box-type domain-containing protein n=1 Tax=Potamilus streckersoni TaxID=2493646 RepID=A0AAE0S917_9BIVA|nr:hypothetical protein CHS0354_008057 [Potamilus streckersoni]